MATFAAAIEQVQAQMRDHVERDTDYLLSDERRREANIVELCAARYALGEMDPTGRLTVARHVGFPGVPPALAQKLGDKLQDAGAETKDAVELAILKALAIGYLSIVETEGRARIEFHPERTTDDVWDFWMTECRVMLEDTGIPKSWAKMVLGMGATYWSPT